MIARILTSLLVVAGFALAQDKPQDKPQDKAQKPAYTAKATILSTCIISGEPLGDDAVSFDAGGRHFRTCCDKCKAKIEKEPAAYIKKLDEATIAAQVKSYPLETCPVSNKKLGSMGEPVKLVLDGMLVQLCCDGCLKTANSKAAALAGKVRDAEFAAQNAKYQATTCPVSGEKLDKDAVSVMFGAQLVKFCCEKCVAKFEKDPAAYTKADAKKGGEKPTEVKKAEPKKG
jgi:YHS domain-containing protein